MQKKVFTTAIAAVLAAGSLASMSACNNAEYFRYDDAERYKAGATNVEGNVTDLEIDWLSGSVNIAYGDVESITVSEISEETLTEELKVHYWLENSTLHIKYAKSGIKLKNGEQPEKELNVLLPASLTLQGLEIESVEANIHLANLNVMDVEIDNVAGNTEATFGAVREFSVAVVSGNANMSFATAPTEGEYSNVHGDLTLYLPAETQFTIEVEKLNGSFNSEFDTVKQGNSYVCGNGANEYEFETVSGSVSLKKLS